MTKLQIARGLALDPDYVGSGTFALLAKKGAGKSYLGRVMAEEFWKAKVPFVLLDPMGTAWGLRSSADGNDEGIPVAIFGGDHGDGPLERGSGQLMADLVVDERLSMILDMSGFGSRTAERQFALDFLERLYRRNRELVHLMLDEADLFAPQQSQSGDKPLLGATENIVRRGRNRGIGITLMTQRPAVLNKDVLTQIDGLVAMRIVGLTDREAIDKWVAGHGDDPDEAAKVKATLASLDNGECWWWIPELGILERVQVRKSRTFDSSPSRKRGERAREPKSYADVDMDAIGEKMAATIERAKAEDPKELRRKVAGLERQVRELEAREPAPTEAPEPEVVEVPALDPDATERIERTVGELGSVAESLTEAAAELSGRLAEVTEERARVETARRQPETSARAGGRDRPFAAPPRPAPRQPRAPARPRAETNGGDPQIKAGARRMLQAAASLHPMPLTRAQVGALAKVKRTGGTFASYLSALKGAGLLDEDSGKLAVTDAGFDFLGQDVPAPATTDEILALWRDRLKAGARTMLDVLVEAHPDWLPREELAERAGLTMSGGTFSSYLSMLRTADLIDEDQGHVRAGGVLYLAAG